MTTKALKAGKRNQILYSLRFRRQFVAQLNRGMPETVEIRLRVWWPLVILPIALVNQLLAPHPVWLVLVVALSGLYGVGFIWVRTQADKVYAIRERTGTLLVAGDTLRQDFELRNDSRLPVLWAEFVDESELPGHSAGRVVACGSYAFYRWNTEVVCERRGVYRLGPHRLHFGDPFGLFGVEVLAPDSDMVLIYPRVVHLPEFELPHGNAGESRQRRRPLRGTLPSASVRDYQPGDSLRHVHWRSSARRNALMVKELEIEPSGDVWVVLDLFRPPIQAEGAQDTLEHSIIVAASIAAKLLSEGERRAVGLLAVSGELPLYQQISGNGDAVSPLVHDPEPGWQGSELERQAVLVPPQPGQAQLWRILAALAPVEPTDVPLAGLLHNSREVLGSRKTLIVVTAQTNVDLAADSYEHHATGDTGDVLDSDASPTDGEILEDDGIASGVDGTRGNWLSELAHLRASGLDSSVLLVTDRHDDSEGQSDPGALGALLAGEDIPCQVLDVGQPLRPALTFRRTRRVVRSTPTGGVVAYDVVEDVG